MGVGNFKSPPEGPKIGPTIPYKDLSEDRKRELGDLSKAAENTIFKAASLDPRVAAQETKAAEKSSPPAETMDVTKEDERAREAAEQYSALQDVLSESDESTEDELRARAMPTPEDKQEFLRCILGNRSYRKTYALFGGLVEVTFRELTVREEDEIFGELGRAHASGAVITEEDWTVTFERLRMLNSLTRVHVQGSDDYVREPDIAHDKITYDSIENHLTRLGASTMYRAILQMSRTFRAQMELMLEAASDSDFWMDVGHGSQQPPTSKEPSTTAKSADSDRGR